MDGLLLLEILGEMEGEIDGERLELGLVEGEIL